MLLLYIPAAGAETEAENKGEEIVQQTADTQPAGTDGAGESGLTLTVTEPGEEGASASEGTPAPSEEEKPAPEKPKPPKPAKTENPYTVSASGLSEGAQLRVKRIDPQDEKDAQKYYSLESRLNGARAIAAFEISLTDGAILDAEAGAAVTLRGYAAESPETAALYHFRDDGEIEELTYTAEADTVSFVTKSFSPFVFAAKAESAAPAATEQTAGANEGSTSSSKDAGTPYEISFIKYGAESNPLEGAGLQVLDGSGTVKEQWISSGEIHKAQLPEGDYVLHEESAPSGYARAADVAFTIGENGAITIGEESATVVAMTDPETEVTVAKVDNAGNPLSGAELQILDKNNEVIFAWSSDAEPQTIRGKLNVDTPYVLHEAAAPSGYAKSADIPFILAPDGSLYLGESIEDGEAADGLTITTVGYRTATMPATGSMSAGLCILMGILLTATGLLYGELTRRQTAGAPGRRKGGGHRTRSSF